MPWIQLRIPTQAEHADAIGNMLSANGAQAVTFVDDKDTPIYEPKPGEIILWPDTQVVGLFDAEQDMRQVIGRLEQARVLGKGFTHKLDQLEDKDWVREWMDNFHPMRFGRRLWICPSWRDVPDPTAVNVMLDPGLAFGTGTHPTTAMCLEWLDGETLEGKQAIDLGCGSGILAIAALKLGASEVLGIDIDPQALLASQDNAQRNGVEKRLTVCLPEDQPTDARADVVMANILAGPLKELRPMLTNFCRPGGRLVLSGILATQAEELCGLYGEAFDMDPISTDQEWARLSGTKR